MYRSLKRAICKMEWRKLLLERCKKENGSWVFKVTVDMIATLNDGDSQLIRRMVNLVLTPGVTMYGQWKHRIISPVPKEEGNFRLHKARPIFLLDVLQKAFWAIVTARMTDNWQISIYGPAFSCDISFSFFL